jgi:hypothetical protein
MLAPAGIVDQQVDLLLGAPGMARSAKLALFPRVVPRDDLGVKVPCTPGKGKC